jgi:indole-3-glycerol phosphate synthase
MKNILQEIVKYKRLEIDASKKIISINQLERKINPAFDEIYFLDALKNKNKIGKAGIIAEIKKS